MTAAGATVAKEVLLSRALTGAAAGAGISAGAVLPAAVGEPTVGAGADSIGLAPLRKSQSTKSSILPVTLFKYRKEVRTPRG